MNRFTRLFTVVLAAGVAAALVTLAKTPTPSEPKPGSVLTSPNSAIGNHVVRVYYFHTTQRCASCKKIEAWSADAIHAAFERELGAGSLEWQVINIDDPLNRHFVDDYKLYTKSLIVVDRVNGQQTRWKNLEKVWQLLQSEAAFRQYVQTEVSAYLEPRS
jgi:hypothetical protein